MKVVHIVYAAATLASVSFIALAGPSQAVGTMTAGVESACQADRLDRPCDPGRGASYLLQGGRVLVR